jgi:glycosyltransferase involved in cell wall biosynthesis
MRQVVMIGTGADTRGGIAAVVQVYARQGLFEQANARYVATHGDGGKWRKLRLALGGWLRYMGLLLTGRVALLHVHSASGPSFWRKCGFMLPSFALGVPVVLHWHGGGFVEFFERCSPRQQRFIQAVFRRCVRVIALSDQWNATLRRLVPGIAPVTLTNPVEVPAAASALDVQPPSVLFLGLVSEAKGVFDLLRAWPQVIGRVPQARLRIGGAGQVEVARSEAERLGIAGSVEWLGWIGPAQKAQVLQDAALLVLPSHNEGVPMAVLEAMAAGVPVVATQVGGIPLAVRDGIDGLLVPARDGDALAQALVALLTDAERRRAMGASARRHAIEQFSADAIVPRVRALWDEVLAVPQGVREKAT